MRRERDLRLMLFSGRRLSPGSWNGGGRDFVYLGEREEGYGDAGEAEVGGYEAGSSGMVCGRDNILISND